MLKCPEKLSFIKLPLKLIVIMSLNKRLRVHKFDVNFFYCLTCFTLNALSQMVLGLGAMSTKEDIQIFKKLPDKKQNIGLMNSQVQEICLSSLLYKWQT